MVATECDYLCYDWLMVYSLEGFSVSAFHGLSLFVHSCIILLSRSCDGELVRNVKTLDFGSQGIESVWKGIRREQKR